MSLGLVTPYAATALYGGGLGVVTDEIADELGYARLGGPATLTAFGLFEILISMIGVGAGAFLGAKHSRGWAAGGAILGAAAAGGINLILNAAFAEAAARA